MTPSTFMPQKFFDGIGVCIYCTQPFPRDHLTEEHIVPKALNGAYVFRHAVCKCCQKLTGGTYETKALQEDLFVVRRLLALKRDKKNMKRNPRNTFPGIAFTALEDPKNLSAYDQYLDVNSYPKIFFIPFYGLPEFLNQSDGKDAKPEGAILMGLNLYNMDFKLVNYPDGVSIIKYVQPAYVLTMVAKIAYAYCVAVKGLNFVDLTDLRDLVTGRRSDYQNFVGNSPPSDRGLAHFFHWLSFAEVGDYLIGRVHLFATCHPYPFYVVLGRLPQ